MNNKNKAFFAIIGTSTLAVALSVGFLANNATNKLLDAKASNVETENLFTQDTEGAHLEKNAVYFCWEKSLNWWMSDDAETRIYFQNDDNSYYAWSSVVTYVYDRGNDSNKPVYQAIVPDFPTGSGLTAWTKFQAIRGEKGGTPTTIDDSSYIFNYGGSLDIKENDNYDNLIGLYKDDYGNQQNYRGTITAVERLEILSWAQEWSKPSGSGSFCSDDGNTDVTSLKTQWEHSKESFDDMGADVKYYFSHVTAVPDTSHSTTANVPDFAARYDLVYFKYSESCGLTNWADRTINL